MNWRILRKKRIRADFDTRRVGALPRCNPAPCGGRGTVPRIKEGLHATRGQRTIRIGEGPYVIARQVLPEPCSGFLYAPAHLLGGKPVVALVPDPVVCDLVAPLHQKAQLVPFKACLLKCGKATPSQGVHEKRCSDAE